MKEFTGKIYFHKHIEYGFISTGMRKDIDDEYIYLGESESITVALITDTRAAEIGALEGKIKQTQAECERNIQIMMGKIESLQALEHKE